MITTSKDNNDRVIAYMEWRNVGQSGFDKLNGEYVYIANFWIHDSHQNDWSIFRELMQDILLRAKTAKWIYFSREKYHGRLSKTYSRSVIMKLIDRGFVMKEVSYG